VRLRRVVKVFGFLIGALVVLVLIAAAVSADVRFVLRAGYEEGRLLLRRRDLQGLIANPQTPEALRSRFRLVLAARAYGADSLGLKVGTTYTTYVNVGRDTLVLVMSASPRYQLRDYLWRFPIVGAVPYHGYFSLDASRKDAERLEQRGFDTYVRPAGAFSTLGWFGDPLFSTALSRDSGSLAETVLHEVTHNTIWVRSSAAFNESLAMFVGYRGAERFFRSRGETQIAQKLADYWDDEKVLDQFYQSLAASLDSVYRPGKDQKTMDAGRDTVFQRARERIGGPLRQQMKRYPVDWLLQQPLNNAAVLAARVYRTRLALFDSVLAMKNGDLPGSVRAIVDAEKNQGGDPYALVAALIPKASATPGAGGSPPGGR